jgi:hypothetical protein
LTVDSTNESRTGLRAVSAALKWQLALLKRRFPVACPRTPLFTGIVLTGLGRRLRSQAESVLILVRRPVPRTEAAIILARTAWELMLTFDYILAQPKIREQRAILYLAHSPFVRADGRADDSPSGRTSTDLNRTLLTDSLADEFVAQGVRRERARRRASKEIAKWATSRVPMQANLREMVSSLNNPQRTEEYESLYRRLSEYSHASGSALLEAMLDSEDSIVAEGDAHGTMMAAVYVAGWLQEYYEGIDRLYSFGWQNELADMSSRIATKWERRGIYSA